MPVELLLLGAAALAIVAWMWRRGRERAVLRGALDTLARAQQYRDRSRFIDEVLSVYKRTGKMSPKQYAAVARIVAEMEAEDGAG